MSEEHVQKMLAQQAIREGVRGHSAESGGDGMGLAGMFGRIEAFLAQAQSAPAPQCIEHRCGKEEKRRRRCRRRRRCCYCRGGR